jgi:hypothetical protein
LRPARRLIFACVWLVIFDQFVPDVQRRVEWHRYEGAQVFRFQNSDLFALGPLVSYLRDHPRGERPRTLFLGNSVIFGYELTAAEAVPARFQELHPETHVFNAAVNGFELGSNYLVSKAIIDSVDRFYVMRGTPGVHPLLASLIPVEAADGRAFHLQSPDRVEIQLQSIVGIWRLYASTYRLQAAMFGTSTRQYVHLRGDTLSRDIAPGTPPATIGALSSLDRSIQLTRWRSVTRPTDERRAELRRQDEVLWKFAELVYGHRKRAVFLQIGRAATGAIGESDIADFNAVFEPFAEIVGLTIPPALRFDAQHLTAEGARRVAEALRP